MGRVVFVQTTFAGKIIVETYGYRFIARMTVSLDGQPWTLYSIGESLDLALEPLLEDIYEPSGGYRRHCYW